MTNEEFEQLVNDGIAAIPKKFLDLLDNVAVVIEDEPTREQLRKLKLHPGWTLFGLYEGVPQSGRSQMYSGVLPDKITIFKNPILQAASTPEDISELVRDTVWHEIAHHFGMNEAEVHNAEEKRRKRKRPTSQSQHNS